MSKLDELIHELCPDGVEYKCLESICNKIVSGGTPKTGFDKYYGGSIPWLRTQEIDFEDILDTGIKITQLGLENSSAKWIPANCVIVAMYGATVGKVAINKIPMTTNQACCNLEINESYANYRYVFHVLCSKYSEIKSLGQGSQTNINAQIIKKINIPIPPLEVQNEIVGILDSFMELNAKLKAELNARKTQYGDVAYKLLIDNNKHKKYFLGEICELNKGNTAIQKAIPGEYPLVVTTTERKSNDTYQFNEPAVCIPLVSSRGHGVASLNHVYYQEGKFALGNILCAITSKNVRFVCVKYLYYYLECTKDYTLVPLMKGGANVSLKIADIAKVKIPIPDINEQEEIISKLEVLEEYCNELLPAEIAAREKQYEHYLNRLLTIPECKS